MKTTCPLVRAPENAERWEGTQSLYPIIPRTEFEAVTLGEHLKFCIHTDPGLTQTLASQTGLQASWPPLFWGEHEPRPGLACQSDKVALTPVT